MRKWSRECCHFPKSYSEGVLEPEFKPRSAETKVPASLAFSLKNRFVGGDSFPFFSFFKKNLFGLCVCLCGFLVFFPRAVQ